MLSKMNEDRRIRSILFTDEEWEFLRQKAIQKGLMARSTLILDALCAFLPDFPRAERLEGNRSACRKEGKEKNEDEE